MMKYRNGRKIAIGFIVGIVLTIATLFTLFLALIFFAIGGVPKEVTDINRYSEIFEEGGVRTGYIIFPESIPENVLETKYFHKYEDIIFSPTVQTYLECSYDDETYRKEIERLENTQKNHSGRIATLLRDENHKYKYPAYIAIENASGCYEYALLPGDNRIIYIFTMLVEKKNIGFDKEYLPNDYLTNKGKEFGSGYSIYYSVVNPEYINTDYTRKKEVEIEDCHSCFAGNSGIYVYIKYDMDGTEFITEIMYCPDMKKYDSQGNTESVTIHDIDGMEYVDVSADEEALNFTVIYKDGEEQLRKIIGD